MHTPVTHSDIPTNINCAHRAYTDLYSSHTSSTSFSPSPSDGGRTPNSLILERDAHAHPHDLQPHQPLYNPHHHAHHHLHHRSHPHHNHHHHLQHQQPYHPAKQHKLTDGGRNEDAAETAATSTLVGVIGAGESAAAGEGSPHTASASPSTTTSTTPTTPTAATVTPTRGEGTYQCQFCDKSFPRLGYLKKHEQVSNITLEQPTWLRFTSINLLFAMHRRSSFLNQ